MSGARLAGLSVRSVRITVIALIAVDLVALAALAVHATSTTTRTVTPLPVAALAPSTTPKPSATATSVALVPGGPVSDVFPVAATSGTPAAVRSTPAAARPTSAQAGPPAPPGTPTIAPNCPLPLSPPAQPGGLQSLIDLAPAFGPFSAEAFAAASAYQPLLQLLGPILAQYPAISVHIRPELTAFLTPWQHTLDAMFALIQPAYSPHREQVLAAETKLAASLAPYAQKLAASRLGGCLVDLEAALVNDTTDSTTTRQGMVNHR